MEKFDIAVIGGGPAGSQAAWKAALLHKSCIWFDRGVRFSRIYWSPRVDNLPGMSPISGREMLAKVRTNLDDYETDQNEVFVARHADTTVETIRHHEGGYLLYSKEKDGSEMTSWAKNVVLATGAIDRQPQLADFRKRDIESILPFANKGLADYCLLCDGHTVKGKRVAVIGCDPGSRGIAKSLKRNFGAKTSIVAMCPTEGKRDGANDPEDAWEIVKDELARASIPLHKGAVESFSGLKNGVFQIKFVDGRVEEFDKAWISMGWYKVNSELAEQLGAKLDKNGFVESDRDCRALDRGGETIHGLYVVGDLRADSWKQIPIAWGEAEAAVIDAFIHRL